MSRYNNSNSSDGCVLILTVAGIICSAIYHFIFCIKLIGVLFILFILFRLYIFFTEDNGAKNVNTELKTDLEKKSTFRINSNKLNGVFRENTLPNELIDKVDIEEVDIKCQIPIDISDFINQNKNLIKLKLTGPFYITKEINKECKISSISIIENDEIYQFLTKLIDFSYLKSIYIKEDIYSKKSLNLVDKLNNLKTLESIQIVAKLNTVPLFNNCPNLCSICLSVNCISLFPYEYLNRPQLKSLDLSNNNITSISKLKYSKMNNNNLEYLYLSSNNIQVIPENIFKNDKLKKISIQYNPINISCLKKLYKLNSDKLSIDSEQKEKIEKETNFKIILILSILVISLILLYLIKFQPKF